MATIDLGKIKLVWKGAYNNSTAYTVDDVVQHTDGGVTSSFICTTNSTGNAPSTGGSVHGSWAYLAKGHADTVSTTLTTQGDILYRDGSGLQRLAKGTAAQVLKMNSGANAPEWGTLSSDYVKLGEVSASSSSSLAVDGYFTSDYDRYEIHASNVQHSNNCDFYYRVYRGGSEVSANEYVNTSNYWYTDTTPSVQDGGNNSGSADTNNPSNYFKMTGDDHYGGQPSWFKIIIHDPLNTTAHKQVEITTAFAGDGSGGVQMRQHATGTIRNNGALSGFAFYPTSGSLTSGKFKIYGLK